MSLRQVLTRPLTRPLGLRREVAILVPVSLVLLTTLAAFTLFSYTSAVHRLLEDRRQAALEVVRAVAAEVVAVEPGIIGDRLARLRRVVPGLRVVMLVDDRGRTVVVSGEVPLGGPLEPFGGRVEEPVVAGPGEGLPGVVSAALPVRLGGRDGVLRVDLDAEVLATQERGLPLLTVLVLTVTAAVALLLVLFLRQLLVPYDTLLARAREVGGGGDPGDGGGGGEVELLVRTFERGIAALARHGAGGADRDDDIHALQRTLAGSLESGLLLLDAEERVIALNPVGAELMGVEVPEEGTPLERVLAPYPSLAARLAEACRQGRSLRREEVTVQRGDREVTFGLTAHPLRRAPEEGPGPGPVRGHMVLFADLTEVRRRAREARLADELGRLGELAAGVAHEMRNSLATLRGYLALARRHPDETAAYLAEVRHEADHLQRVLEDFLSFARPGSIRLEEVSLAAVARRAALDPALEGAPVTVGVTGEDRLGGDPQLLERAVRNLLRNAVEAQREAGTADRPVELTVERREEGLDLVVADRGGGVPEAVADRLFQPFATGRAGGVGLGLSLAHRIVDLHGGTLRLEPGAEGGTRAVMHFPAGNIVTQGNDSPSATLSPDLSRTD